MVAEVQEFDFICNVLMELCAIRDNITTCDIANITDIIAMIEDNDNDNE